MTFGDDVEFTNWKSEVTIHPHVCVGSLVHRLTGRGDDDPVTFDFDDYQNEPFTIGPSSKFLTFIFLL